MDRLDARYAESSIDTPVSRGFTFELRKRAAFRAMTESSVSFEDRRGVVRYVQAFRQHIVLIIVFVLVATGGAALYSQTATKRYEASTDILIDPFESGDNLFRGFHAFRQPLDGSSPVVTAIRVLRSHENYDATYKELARQCGNASISISPLSQADIVNVTGASSQPFCAALAANTFARVAVDQRSTVFRQELTARVNQLRARARRDSRRRTAGQLRIRNAPAEHRRARRLHGLAGSDPSGPGPGDSPDRQQSGRSRC